MKRYSSKCVFKGVAIGTVRVLSKAVVDTSKRQIADVEAEKSALCGGARQGS